MTVAVVTGGSRGIGRACAIALAEAGSTVAVTFRSDDVAAKETVEAARALGGTAEALRLDVTDADEVAAVFTEIQDALGPIGVLVNNAGMSRDGLMLKYPPAALAQTLQTNLAGAFVCSQRALPGMLKQRWGRIVNMSSAVALRGNAGQTAYAASKAGLLGLTRSLAREVGRRGITVNAVCPGLIETDMTTGLSEDARTSLVASTPAERLGTPQEVAAVVRFLASDEAAYVNGAVVAVDGGLTA